MVGNAARAVCVPVGDSSSVADPVHGCPGIVCVRDILGGVTSGERDRVGRRRDSRNLGVAPGSLKGRDLLLQWESVLAPDALIQ